MDITRYFIKHPVIALILNAMIIVVGYLSLDSLQLREYPEVHFPKVQVRAHYPSASAELVENSVTNPLEDKLSGIEGLETLTSKSKYEASYITLRFKSGTSIDKALVAIRDAVGLADLPKEVMPPVVERSGTSEGLPFMIIALEASSMDFGELTHYAHLNLKNAFRGIKGVASVEIWGQPYTYNITLDERKMFAFGINTDEVFEALRQGNLSLPAGKFQNKISVTLNSELKTTQDYENLVVKEKSFSGLKAKQPAIFLKQIADIKLQTDDKKFRVRINGKPGLCIAIQNSNDANLLEVSTSVRKTLDELKPSLSKELKLNLVSDQADFVRQSLKNVKSSIFEAIIFVLIIVFLFLRNIKATIIPLITIPISLIGSFLFLKMCGFSINIMTLLAMVLAIGLVVDDAIVVLENIQRHIDKGLAPLAAATKGSKEIGPAIVAMTLTLASVYAPLAFITGAVGELFIEFGIALASSVFVSGFVALTLSPLMCAKTLKQHDAPLWPKIDIFLEYLTASYLGILNKVLFYQKTCALTFLASFCCIALLVSSLPNETAPKEDRSLVGIYIPPITGKDIDTMEQKISLVEAKVNSLPESAQNLVFMGDWGGNVVLPLKPQSARKLTAEQIVESIRPLVATIPSIDAHPWSDDSGLPGLNDSMIGGSLSLVISTTESYAKLFETVEKIRKSVEDQKLFETVHHDLKLDSPSYRIDLETNEMSYLNLSPSQIAKTVEVFFSGDQSLSFSKNGILYNITLKGKKSPWDLNELYVTNKLGKRISIGAVAKLIPTSGADSFFHYNQMRSVVLSSDLPKNVTFGKGMEEFKHQVSKELPATYKKTWSGNAKSFGESKNTMTTLFMLAVIFIYAILAMQFENFIDPFIILFTVPLACVGGLSLMWLTGGSLNIYTQIGLITLIGLITKHGILIVEFVNQIRKKDASLKNNASLRDAIIEASVLRLRPILMTTSAMILGSAPLVISSDAGYEARQAIGIVLLGGLIIGTFFTLFILPTMCYTIKNLTNKGL